MQGNHESKKILVVDDHPVVRRGLAQFIDQEDGLTTCAGVADEHEAYTAIAVRQPDLVIVDLELKNGLSGLEFIKELRRQYPGLPILVFSMHDEAIYAERALRAGAQGYVVKQEKHGTIIQAIRAVLQGQLYVTGQVALRILQLQHKGSFGEETPVASLSDRELEVMRLLGQGYRTRHIAERLNLSAKTIEVYKARIRKKLMLKDTAELVRYAIKWNVESMN